MVKKGKEKDATPSGPSNHGGKAKKGTGVPTPNSAEPTTATVAAVPPPNPTVKQIIGGSSWTGKLPVNLLSEHCQRQHWQAPDYDSRKTSDGFSYFVTLSARDPKTQELTRLEPFKLPPSHKSLVCCEMALEAKHHAATYALFRVCSMQNKHMVLPPNYKTLWKEFQALKVEDVKEGKAWMYDADPFKTLRERHETKSALEKKRRELEAIKDKAHAMPGASSLVLRDGSLHSSGRPSALMKGWTTVPKIEMGKRTRAGLEALVRRHAVWNPHRVCMAPARRIAAVTDLSRLGFRSSHAEEAVGYCKDHDEALEWLLIHVPEDDLPAWALPESYSAGVSVVSTDLKREAALKRLAEPGYSLDLARRILDDSNGDELAAAVTLQRMLVGPWPSPDSNQSDSAQSGASSDPVPILDGAAAERSWEDEVSALESVLGDSFERESSDVICVRLNVASEATKTGQDVLLRIRKTAEYPVTVLLGLVSKGLPCYIRLSIIKRALRYSLTSLSSETLKVYFILDWIQQHIDEIITSPGKLSEIAAVSSAASKSQSGQPLQRNNDGDWRKRGPTKVPGLDNRQEQNFGFVGRMVEQSDVTIISGETGSGKSTQSMQFVLDDLYSRGLGTCANIVITQPRRISALGLADRVAEERCCRVGDEIGYTIRGESRQSSQTKITFVTTGVLLRRLQTSGGNMDDVVAALADISHVVIDEVHERSLDTDFLLTLLRDAMAMARHQSCFKLVLMSATLDAAEFGAYFAAEGLSIGTVQISGRTFPVDDYYLDDVIRMTGYGISGTAAAGLVDSTDSVGKAIQKLSHRIDFGLLAETIEAVDEELSYHDEDGSILVFLPGVAEINQACTALRSLRSSASSFHLLPLHASLQTREQKRVFEPAPAGRRKVVVATNVAETSITIDDVVVVIDSGRVKQTSLDDQTNMRRLEETWASRAACKQRCGRAGRVRPGKCFKLFTRQREQQMAERPEPEMRRVPLEQLCLSVRAMGLRDVGGFLARCPSPPSTAAVDGAVRLLGRMGALDGDELTALGRLLATIPADLRCAKLMIYGAIFGCLDDCVTAAAILSTRSPFVSVPPDKRDLARAARARFSRGHGDVITDLHAFQQWDTIAAAAGAGRSGHYRGGNGQVRAWCDESFLSHQTLGDIAVTRTQYYAVLADMGLTAATPPAPRPDGVGDDSDCGGCSSSPALLRALIAGAFSPQVARVQLPDKKFASSMSGAVELDPEARTIRYYCEDGGTGTGTGTSSGIGTRVFVHPSSTLFDCQSFVAGAAYLSYFGMAATTKVFIRDLTPFNSYTLLLFCGAIELDTLGRGVVVDRWLRLRGWARIGVLATRLRAMLDAVIALKIEDPGRDVATHAVVRAAVRLVELNGMDA